jgi:hypothetical protein
MQPSEGPSSPEILKKVEDLLRSAEQIPQSNQTESDKRDNSEHFIKETETVAESEKSTKSVAKQTDIRSHMQGASSIERKRKKKKKKAMKADKKKRKNSKSPGEHIESKKGRQVSPNLTDYESPYSTGSMTEYESTHSASSESDETTNAPP